MQMCVRGRKRRVSRGSERRKFSPQVNGLSTSSPQKCFFGSIGFCFVFLSAITTHNVIAHVPNTPEKKRVDEHRLKNFDNWISSPTTHRRVWCLRAAVSFSGDFQQPVCFYDDFKQKREENSLKIISRTGIVQKRKVQHYFLKLLNETWGLLHSSSEDSEENDKKEES